MRDQPPKDPVFDHAPGGPGERRLPNSIGTFSEHDKIEAVRKLFQQRLPSLHERNRASQFLPYLLVRSVVGDHGNRPLAGNWADSPDIWIAPGDPMAAPAVPADRGQGAAVGKPHTLYAHVWNLGRAPIAGVKVEFWATTELGLLEDGAGDQAIGVARVDLAPRSSLSCHTLVKCPKPWVPNAVFNWHLIVRVSSIGDPLSHGHPWNARLDRHVARRAITPV